MEFGRLCLQLLLLLARLPSALQAFLCPVQHSTSLAREHKAPVSTFFDFITLLHCPCVCIFLAILSFDLIGCTVLGCFKWNCPLQEARWGCGMPSISPGFIGNSWSLLLGKGPDMNLLLRQRLSHCFQPWPALRSSVQSIILVSGGQRKRHFHKTKYVWRLTYLCCTCKNKKNICVSPYPLITL